MKGFGGVLRPSGCVLEDVEGVWSAPKQAQASFEEGLGRFLRGFLVLFRGLKPKSRISENVDFPWVKLIFSRVWAMKNRAKIDKNSKLEVKIRFWGPKISQDGDLGGQEADFGDHEGGFGGQEADFGGQKGPASNYMLTFGIRRRNVQGL